MTLRLSDGQGAEVGGFFSHLLTLGWMFSQFKWTYYQSCPHFASSRCFVLTNQVGSLEIERVLVSKNAAATMVQLLILC